MFTRSGDPLPVRLAQDIYVIIEVAEGGDPNVLKPMISVSRTRKLSVLRTNTDIGTESRTRCNCAADVALLKDSIATLQAEHVLLKQSIHVSVSLRTKQIDTLKLGISDIKSQLLNYSTHLKDCSFSTLSGIQNIVNSAASQLLQVEDRVRWLETVLNTDNVAVISKFSETLKTDPWATQNDRPPPEASDLIPTHTSGQSSFCDNDVCANVLNGDICFTQIRTNIVSDVTSDEHSATEVHVQHTPSTLYSDVAKRTTTRGVDDDGGRGPFVPTTSCDDGGYQTGGWIDSWQAPRVPVIRQPKGRPIPVRVTTRRDASEETPPYGALPGAENEPGTTPSDDFMVPRRKRTKSFCVMGLSRNLNTSILTSTINRKGPTVAIIRIFPSRADEGKVMLRINVNDDGHADEMLSYGFWPSYVSCKRCRARTTRATRPVFTDRGRDLPPRFQRKNRSQGHVSIDEYSDRYSPLIEEVD